MRRAFRWLAGLCLIASVSTVRAADVAVNDRASLVAALHAATPGTVIRIERGDYDGGLFATLRGEHDRPIVIEGRDPNAPPVIVGGDTGIQLAGSRYVTLRDLHFRDASLNSTNIDDGGTGDGSALGITIEHVTIEGMHPPADRGVVTNGIKLSGVGEFAVRDCTIRAWGHSSAIDCVGCRDGTIERCTFADASDAATGPQLKGGTQRIVIRDCTFDQAGARAINAGGSTGPAYFRPRDARYEAKDITIENNVFRASQAAVAFVGIDGGVVRHNTIIQPQKWIFRILQESRGERFVPARNVKIERNLIVYRKAVVGTVINIGDGTAPETFAFAENWWWCADDPHAKPSLPSPERGGVVGIDPQLPADGARPLPRNSRARDYGAGAVAPTTQP